MKTSNSKHLTLEDRVRIETMISEGFSARYIALRLDKSPSTISRELKKHSSVRIPRHCDCLNSSSCYCRHVCGASSCPKKCKLCSKAKKYCQDYVQVFCDSLIDHPLHLCNSCSKRKVCHFEQRHYSATPAHQQYLDTLTNSRNGFDLSVHELQLINDVVSPLVMQEQSIYHIIHSNKDYSTGSLPLKEHKAHNEYLSQKHILMRSCIIVQMFIVAVVKQCSHTKKTKKLHNPSHREISNFRSFVMPFFISHTLYTIFYDLRNFL